MTTPAGTPVWFELNTPDVAAAQDFYAAVTGWTVAASPMPEHGGYLIATAPDGDAIAGMMTPPPGAPAMPGWATYFASDDVDATVAATKERGGALRFGPMDIPHIGRFAILADPQGVTFVVMKGDSPEPATAFKQAPNQFGHGVWIELATPDPDAAIEFYGSLFGWGKQGAIAMGEMGEYTFIGRDGEAPPGAVMSSATTGAPARWNSYILVPDIDTAIATATGKGGTLIQGPDPIPGGDYSANITDPHGSQLGLVGSRKAA
ncbi:glyoxalase [Sphingomonas sp. Leaf339]|uniref:VOC family protein n=1 Tax=Sphingomonas sp. Leaf339 TaxID=1736343 RepID=UPI0006FD98BF|nr:VOC family protein [Sphingomonas sp. Leaf339]KQU47416.1 glyoxalase [Sphingomonas sp. Leaf339]